MQMFPDQPDPETETLFSRNPSDTCVNHLTDIERQPGFCMSPKSAWRFWDDGMHAKSVLRRRRS
jgi:hypothetical protein